ncbi:potassium voltage-gated channel protein Shab-like isoform X3 [Tigriopus californicus]|uniref:potassium voltage-gated channel protein Shab-like isoform X3 n=1 Tax=Tigriopus californicus TaxID=6832 RepID=UPI0027DA685E|nr:potassium voltage-gated channel protein Shab-like isoform X3 [Tigriopus californicus]
MVLKLNLSPVLPHFWEPGDPTLLDSSVDPRQGTSSWNHPRSHPDALLGRLQVDTTRSATTIAYSTPQDRHLTPRVSGENRVVVMSELCHAGEVKTIGLKVDSMHQALSQISQELTNIRNLLLSSPCSTNKQQQPQHLISSNSKTYPMDLKKVDPPQPSNGNVMVRAASVTLGNSNEEDAVQTKQADDPRRQSVKFLSSTHNFDDLDDEPGWHNTPPNKPDQSSRRNSIPSRFAKSIYPETEKDSSDANPTKNQVFITINVGGKRHDVRWDTLDKFPTSRLGRLRACPNLRGIRELCDDFSYPRREYYFDRSPRNFDAVLGLYRTGKLHLSQGVCVQDFCEELEYWGLCDLHLEPCCQHTYYRARWLLPVSMRMEEDMDDQFGEGMYANFQKRLWNLFENPNSSPAAKVVAVISCLFVVASTFSLIISTLPMFQVKKDSPGDEEHFIFAVAEAIFVGWFSFEYVVRFIAAPHKLRFAKVGMNVIDLLGVLPYFLSLGLSVINKNTGDSSEIDANSYQDEMMRIAQIFRIMRILRIFKLARHITGLQTLGFTLKNSYKELGLLMLVVIMGMLIFSGLAYVSEKNEEGTAFISMPQALYWAIITMTSVGYGDIYPTTWFGKLVGSACAICGVLCISLPIPIIVNNFNKFYEKAKIEEEIDIKRKKASWEEAKRDLLDARRKSCIAGVWYGCNSRGETIRRLSGSRIEHTKASKQGRRKERVTQIYQERSNIA